MKFYIQYRVGEEELLPKEVPEGLELVVEKFKSTALDQEKLKFILKKIDEEWNSYICISEPGINIYHDFSLELKFQIQDKDILAISTPNGLTLSFLYIKANSQTKQFFQKVLECTSVNSPLNQTYQSAGLASIFNILSKNYCRIKAIDSRFIHLPTVVFNKVYEKIFEKAKILELPKAFYSCHYDRVSNVKDVQECMDLFLKHKTRLQSQTKLINNSQLENLQTLGNETHQLVSQFENSFENLKAYVDLIKIKLDEFKINGSIKPDNQKEIPKTVVVYNQPIHLKDKRFNLANESRKLTEEASENNIRFINHLPNKNSSFLKSETDKPFLKDLIEKACQSNCDWVGYVNADVIFSKDFLPRLSEIYSLGYNAISSMTYSISPEVKDLNEAKESKALIPLRGGRDFFLFRKSLWPVIQAGLPDYLIGEPEWDIGLFHVLTKSKQVKLFDQCSGGFIFQLFHEQKWSTETKLSRWNSKQSKLFGVPIHQTFTSLKNRSLIS